MVGPDTLLPVDSRPMALAMEKGQRRSYHRAPRLCRTGVSFRNDRPRLRRCARGFVCKSCWVCALVVSCMNACQSIRPVCVRVRVCVYGGAGHARSVGRSRSIDRSIALSIGGRRLKRSFLTLVKVARPGNACSMLDSTTRPDYSQLFPLGRKVSARVFGMI